MKINVFWDVMAYSVVDVHRRFRDCLLLHGRVSWREMKCYDVLAERGTAGKGSIHFYQTTRRYIPEDGILKK
jgi:hypothetical protein